MTLRTPTSPSPAGPAIQRIPAPLVVLALACLTFAVPAWAAPIAVTTTAAVDPGACTLAAAVEAAQSGSDYAGCSWGGEAAVELQALTYRVAGQITVSGGVVVHGHGATLVRDDPAVQHRFFIVQGDLELHQVTLEGGDKGQGRGGAVKVTANASFLASACTFRNNHADWAGGALFSLGSTVVDRSTFDGNSTNNHGGAIFAVGGDLTVARSTFVDNRGEKGGGGAILADVELLVENSTFSANRAVWGGALYQRTGSAAVTMATFKDNAATAVGGGTTLYAEPGATLAIGRSALVGDSPGPLCAGSITSLGDNAASDDSCGLPATGDQESVAIALSDLVDHGGPTLVHAPLCDGWQDGACSSPLIDRYPCEAFPASPDAPHDQRDQLYRQVDLGYTPTGYPETGDACDVGAYESGCQTVYWLNAQQHKDQVVRFHREQTSSSTRILDNGACYAHAVDFDSNLGDCSVRWEIYGGLLQITNIVFVSDACPHDCFTDPGLCAQQCAVSSPAGWVQAAPDRFDVAACEPPAAPLSYVVEYASILDPGTPLYWDPRVPVEPPPPTSN